MLDTASFIALAAVDGDKGVGAIDAYELKKFERVSSEIQIYGLAVTLTHRRESIATALIQELRAIGAARGGV